MTQPDPDPVDPEEPGNRSRRDEAQDPEREGGLGSRRDEAPGQQAKADDEDGEGDDPSDD